MIIVTGAAGFIGSNMVYELVERGYHDVICVDLPGKLAESKYYKTEDADRFVDADQLPRFIRENHRFVQFIIHMGACSDTTHPDKNYYKKYNLDASVDIWNLCVEFGLPLIYASSAATYGDGTQGYSDKHVLAQNLQPLNYYGWSKHEFDKFALTSKRKPFFWAGLKFFNVYGPNEDHKNGMSSVIRKAYKDISKTGKTTLFRSHHPDYKDGYQTRDFIYVKDVCDVMLYLMEYHPKSGIFNVGTGIGRTFIDLATQTFVAMGRVPEINFVDTPEKIREKYQYFTEACMDKLQSIGYTRKFYTLEEGIHDYVQGYLMQNTCKVTCLESVYS